MKTTISICAWAIAVCIINQAQGAIQIDVAGDTGDAPAGWVSNDMTANSDYDLLSAAIFITLDSGVVYNNNVIFAGVEVVQQSPGDTYFTINGNPGTSIVGSAGDLGHASPVFGQAEFGPTVIGVSWSSSTTDDFGYGLPLGTFSFSEDANGEGALLIYSRNRTFSLQDINIVVPLTVVNGVLSPEPASFGLLGLGGVALMGRKR